jgi:hypothetical protein
MNKFISARSVLRLPCKKRPVREWGQRNEITRTEGLLAFRNRALAADGRWETDGDETGEHSLALIPLPRTWRQGNQDMAVRRWRTHMLRTTIWAYRQSFSETPWQFAEQLPYTYPRRTFSSGLQPTDPISLMITKRIVVATAVCFLLMVPSLHAARPAAMANPDFTQGEPIPAGADHDWNLGATGARGWMYSDKLVTTDARQIAITTVDQDSPAN